MCTKIGNNRFFHLIITLVLLHFLIQLALFNELFYDDDSQNITNIIIWWTPFISATRTLKCGDMTCMFTANRTYFHDAHCKALLFYGSSFNQSDLPLPRGDKIWSLFHEESPRNSPILSHEDALSLFNFSSTFSRKSDLPLTLQYLPSLDDIINTKYYKSFDEKTSFEDELSPVMYLQSDCSTPNNRDSYVEELMRYIKIDSYGRCLNNKILPSNLNDSMKTLMSPDLLELTSRYKFVIAFENGICDDYITEKLWRPIIAGSLPIYIGSPTVKDWLPNEKTVLLPSEFSSVEKLASKLSELRVNRSAYDEYFDHKRFARILNNRLRNEYRQLWPEEGLGVVEDFECLICRNLNSKTKIVNRNHYDCPEPYSVLDGKTNVSNWWLQIFKSSQCEARQLKNFVQNALSDKKFNFKESDCYKGIS